MDISSEYNISVSVTFNVFNISLFDVGDDLKMNSFNECVCVCVREREREREWYNLSNTERYVRGSSWSSDKT